MNPSYLIWQAEHYSRLMSQHDQRGCYPSAARARAEAERAEAASLAYRGIVDAAQALAQPARYVLAAAQALVRGVPRQRPAERV